MTLTVLRGVLLSSVLSAAAFLAGCAMFEAGVPDDVVDNQAEARLNRPAPRPTDLPPGLADDLPTTQAHTQPQTQPQTQPLARN